MSGGPRPPVPGLIPLAALSRRPGRPRRRPESIDAGTGSRCVESRAAAPGRRRHHRRRASTAAAVGKQSRSLSPALERPPRVNPIFVWVRQEDTRIVDVKCEDYDKRNRILLTKTAHGWRAIPRTEMLGAPRASAEESPSSPSSAPSHSHHHRHHHKRRYRKSKNQQSASVQFPETDPSSEPPWVAPENINIESLLPSHTIPIKRIPSPENSPKSVNSATEQKFARIVPECSTPDKICDVSPLENLLAVAELELKQHMQSGHWNSDPEGPSSANVKDTSEPLENSIDEIDEILKSKSDDIQSDKDPKEQECNYNDDDEMSMNDILSRLEQSLQSPHGFGSENTFDDEMPESDCKFGSEEEGKPNNSENISAPPESNQCERHIKGEYTDNDLTQYSDIYSNENKMTEILEAVKCFEPLDDIKEDYTQEESLITENSISEQAECGKTEVMETEIDNGESETNIDKPDQSLLDQVSNDDDKSKNEDNSTHTQVQLEKDTNHISTEEEKPQVESPEQFVEAESSNIQDELLEPQEEESVEDETAVCLDLSVKSKPSLTMDTTKESPVREDNDDVPTDLSIRKQEPSPKVQPPRPTSQNSEAIQSPQPSGIPAVPASPDIVSTSTSISKPRSVFLESLLANSMSKSMNSGADTNLGKSKEPLDLGQNRKSASPTVTCSEEVLTPSTDLEPPLKKIKSDDITLKNLLDKDIDMLEHSPKKPPSKEHTVLPDTPRLLSLLKESSDTKDPLAEYKQLLTEIDIPNPLMVPKDVFPDLLKHPRREILKILSGHSNKNVALDDILVVYKDKLLGALESSSNSTILNSGSVKYSECTKLASKPTTNKPSGQSNNISEKISSANTASKRKIAEISNKMTAASPDTKNPSANDNDPGTEGILNPLFWAGCPNPFETIGNYSNHNEFIQALYAASSLPYLPSQLGDLHPGLQMMLGNNVTGPLGFPPLPPINFNNPFELSMWQEAMMQASILKNKNPYDNAMLNQQNIRNSVQKKTHHSQNHVSKYSPRVPNGHSKNISSTQQMQQQSVMHPSFNQASSNKQTSWQNPYLGLSNFQQSSSNLALDTNQYNPFSHKNNLSPTNKHSPQLSPPVLQKKNKETNIFSQYNEQEKRLQQQIMQEHQKMQQIQQQKLLRQHQHQQLLQQQQQLSRQRSDTKHMLSTMGKRTAPLNAFDFSKEHLQDVHKQHGNVPVPIDLSGAQNLHSKSKSGISGHGTGLVTSSRSIMEDIPEVGSTTGGNEDMQDGHAQLWHPLFGNQNKGYNALNLPSLAAMGK